MLTDLARYLELLKDFGVDHEVTNDGVFTVVRLNAKTMRVSGYFGFFTEMTFDADGKFVAAGVWE